jgi:hypothetical protein
MRKIEVVSLKDGTAVRLDFERGLPCLVETTMTAVPGNQPTAEPFDSDGDAPHDATHECLFEEMGKPQSGLRAWVRLL